MNATPVSRGRLANLVHTAPEHLGENMKMNTPPPATQDLIRPRFVLCDMDGTLVDTEELKSEAWRLAVEEASGATADKEAVDALYAKQVGGVAREMVASFISEFQLDIPSDDFYGLREKYRKQLYQDRDRVRSLARTHVVGFLRSMRDAAATSGELVLALVTTAPRAQVDVVINALDVHDLFDEVVCGLEKSAGNPACYRAALERLKARPEDCLAIEDSPAGYEAARAVGVPCLLIPNRFTRERMLNH